MSQPRIRITTPPFDPTSIVAAYTSTVKHLVKAGESISKGQAVYVTGSTGNAGTNMIVSKASNAIEMTSSKTMGLLETSLETNGQGYVITEGLLSGLDTSTAGAAGDPVWLGTDGNLIYGLANKPVAPAHLVFIGIVTRKQQNNGEIFVKCQNGFEVRELHDAVIESNGSLTDNEVFAYDSASGMWKNQTATEAGLQVRVSGVTDTEIGYLDGVTSAIQTQLDNKINTTGTNTISLTTTNESDPLTIQSKNGHGGVGFAGILTVENTTSGTTNPKKFIRMNSTGGLEIINNGYTATIFSISDLGDLGGVRNATFSGAISATNFNNDAWNSYVPSLSTESGTWTIGNGSIDGAWRLINRTCHFRLKITFGSTTSAGPGTLNISLPTQAASSTYQFPVSLLDNGNAWYEATANGDYLGNRLKFAMICNSGGSSKSSEGVTATNPFTFGAGDAISISGTYEIG